MHYPVAKATILISIVLSGAEMYSKLAISRLDPTISYDEAEVPYFLVKPDLVWKYPWTLLTAAFTGRRLVLSIIQTTFLALALRFFERAWGSRSLGKYILLVSVVPVTIAMVVDLILRSKDMVGGSSPLVIAFLVALKQANPFTHVLGGVEIKPKYLVMPALIFYTLFGIIDPSVTIMAWTSLGLSWWYLRYIKSLVMDQLLDGPQVQKGDRSDSFRFAAFFYPRQVTALADELSNKVYSKFGKNLINPVPVTSDADRQRALGEQLLAET